MAKFGSNAVAFLLIDGYSVLGFTTVLNDALEALIIDSTVLGDAWGETAFTGIRKASLTQEGFFDDAAGNSNAALVSNAGISRILAYGVEGNTVGKHFIGWTGAMQINYQRLAVRGDLQRANAKYAGNGAVDQGFMLHALTQESTASGNTQATSVDNAAATTNGGAVYLEVPQLTLGGYTDVTIKVRDSADNAAWADLAGGTFTNVSAAPNAQRLAIAGTIRRYTACSWTFNGAGAAETVTFMTGIVRY